MIGTLWTWFGTGTLLGWLILAVVWARGGRPSLHRAAVFSCYVGVVGVVLGLVVALVLAYKGAALVVLLLFVAAVLAWPHRWYLAGRITRPFA